MHTKSGPNTAGLVSNNFTNFDYIEKMLVLDKYH